MTHDQIMELADKYAFARALVAQRGTKNIHATVPLSEKARMALSEALEKALKEKVCTP
jgi:hypothetical protein